jgi:predicted acylesterase/phospholipase RssA
MAVADPYDHYVDLVCEGGGVKGIGLAGAHAVLDERGFQPQNVAGTSAGAITAALIAARYTPAEIREIVFGLDFRQFEGPSWVDRGPLVGKPLNILLETGIFEGDRFLEWMRGLLAAKGVRTFADLRTRWEDPKYRSRLQVIASDVTARQLLVLPRDAGQLGLDPDTIEVAPAVRMSMSIPIFFESVRVANQLTNHQHVIVDGGMLSNFPVWLFDCSGEDVPDWHLRAPPGRARPEGSDQHASAPARALAPWRARPRRPAVGDGAHDDGGPRPHLRREGAVRAHDPDPDARRAHDRVRAPAGTRAGVLRLRPAGDGCLPGDVGLPRLRGLRKGKTTSRRTDIAEELHAVERA